MTLKGFTKWYKEWKAKYDAEKKRVQQPPD